MKISIAILVLLISSVGYARGMDDVAYDPEYSRMKAEARLQVLQKEAQRQRTWKAVYNRIQQKIAPKELVMPEKLLRYFDLEFVEWLADQLAYLDTGDLIQFENCWHIYGVEIVRKYGYTKVCLKYNKLSNEYRSVGTEMMNEYQDALEKLK